MKRKLQIVAQRDKLQSVVRRLVSEGDTTGVAIALSAVSMLNWVLDQEENMITAEITTTLNRLRVRIDQELAESLGVLTAPEGESESIG